MVWLLYKGRVQLLPHYNAGIKLLDVTTADSGQYSTYGKIRAIKGKYAQIGVIQPKYSQI